MNQYKFLLKRLPLTLCLVLALTLLPVTARAEEDFSPDYTWYEGGTEESYTITTARQLLALANLVNGTDEQTKTDFAGKTIKLGADLDLSVYGSAWNGGKGWIPIGIKWASGDTGQVFKGTFNGQYHTITGLYINDSTTSDNTGLFGVIADGGTVKNLGLTGVNITGYWYVGGVVGEQLLQGTVEACYATGKVESYSSVGGLVGAVSSSGAVRNCAALNLSVTGTGRQNIGRAVGSSTGTLEGNVAFDGMSFIIEGKQQTITDGAGDHKNGADVNCMALTVATGFPQALTQTPWTFNPGALPGLNGQTVEVPANLLFAAAVTHDGDTTGFNSFKAASDYVSGLDGTTIENTTITLGMDTEIGGGKYQKSDGDMPAKPCTIDGGGHKLTATTQNIYLNADTAMKNIKVGGTSTFLNASSYDRNPHKLTLGAEFSAQGSISGNGSTTGGSQLQVDADIDCKSLGNFSNVSLDDGVTVTLASDGTVYGIGTLAPGNNSAFAFNEGRPTQVISNIQKTVLPGATASF